MDVLELLEQLGFGEYEARAYGALLQHGAVTGYELAKVSGIPRANIYGVLQKLEDRAAVLRVEFPDGTRYAPVAAEEVLARMERQFQETLDAARVGLQQLAQVPEPGYVWNVTDYHALLEHARTLLLAAEEELLLALYPPEAAALADAMTSAQTRGVRLATLCMGACPEPCGGCRGSLYRYQMLGAEAGRWLLVVAGGKEVLAAQMMGPQGTTAIRARQPLLVEVMSWYIRHSIALATLVAALSPQLEGMLGSEARQVLATLGPAATGGDWLAYVRQFMPRTGT